MASKLFDRLKSGLEDGIAHQRGERKLRVTEIVAPDPPRVYRADDIKLIRERLNISQAGLARLMYVSDKTVQAWEQGIRTPQHSSARLLQFIENPNLLSSYTGSGQK